MFLHLSVIHYVHGAFLWSLEGAVLGNAVLGGAILP